MRPVARGRRPAHLRRVHGAAAVAVHPGDRVDGTAAWSGRPAPRRGGQRRDAGTAVRRDAACEPAPIGKRRAYRHRGVAAGARRWLDARGPRIGLVVRRRDAAPARAGGDRGALLSGRAATRDDSADLLRAECWPGQGEAGYRLSVPGAGVDHRHALGQVLV